MLSFSTTQRYFVYNPVCDMRMGFDTLAGLVNSHMQQNALSGDCFVFFNKRRTHIKLLWWDQDGFSLYTKRLERGVFENFSPEKNTLTAAELLCLIRGISLRDIVQRKRYKHLV